MGSDDFVGDRFLRIGGAQWTDLATGGAAHVRVRRGAERLPVAAVPRAIGPPVGNRVLTDEGALGIDGWFDARICCDDRAEDVEAWRNAGRVIADVATRASAGGAIGAQRIRVDRAALSSPMRFAARLAVRLRALGYVTMRGSATLSPELALHLTHRHVALIVADSADREGARLWLQRAARVSVRGHLVIDMQDIGGVDEQSGGPSGGAAGGSIVCAERTTRCGGRGRPAPEPQRRFERAVLAERRGRRAEAERWLRSAVETARRHGDELVLVRSATRLVECLLDRGAWRHARALSLACLAAVRDGPLRVALTAAAIDALLAAGEIARADGLIAELSAEGGASGCPAHGFLTAGAMASHFWQGRFEEAERLARGSLADPRDIAMIGLVGWAVGDRALVTSAAERLRAQTGGCETPWSGGPSGPPGPGLEARGSGSFDTHSKWSDPHLSVEDAWRHGPRHQQDVTIARAMLATLDACVAADANEAARRGRQLARLASRAAASRAARLGMLVAAEAWLCSGHDREARRCISALARSALTPIEAALAAWLHDGRRGGAATMGLAARVARLRADGIRRWGLGRAGMHMLHVVPALLQVMQEAEDEAAALRQACTWLRQSAVAEAVAFVDAGTMRVVASEGWGRSDLESPDLIAAVRAGTPRLLASGPVVVSVAPIRYAGTVIGAAIVRAAIERRATAEQAALTLASIAAPALRSRLDAIAIVGDRESRTPEILGRSPAIAALRESLGRAAPTPFAVLIEGESGTGKELVARAIHRLSARRDRRFCAVNCAALTDELVESELFGSARGAFTGAVAPRAGLFEEAHGGTLFLDEISELSPRAQAKMLRALQEREVRRLGENTPRAVDVRVVAATNLPLSDAVARGRFREDLLFRLAVIRIHLPPLRDRVEDVPLLALACWKRLSAETTTQAMLGPDAIAVLCRHRWRGNVRELQNVMAALVVAAPRRGRVTARLVGHVLASSSSDAAEPAVPLERARSSCERSAITAALARHAGRRALAARELGLTRQGLTKAIKRLGLDEDEDAAGVA